ncbi:DUF4148 domain-containing protein [Paraburkholderia aromaticivorans]|uniref:DUF4148 domain-containing protein n=1 Tax=Paraburkholderia aromaticivorans TaxID=2026199 RepID=UPI0014561BFB|nr:DUF4148 domain-containing protein [Paraburkholderia aromaticivorans]
MNSIITLALASAVLVTSAAQAQGLTRAEVRQQLIEALANGLHYVTESSYPEVHPSFAHMVKANAATQPAQSGEGGVPAGSHESGGAPHGLPMPDGNPHCVGPVSFCSTYSGS